MICRLAALTVLLAVAGFAQPRSIEVFGLGGYGRVGGDEGSLGGGPAVAGALHSPFMRRLAVDLDVAWARATREFSDSRRFENDLTLVSASLVYRWGSERMYGFAGGGVGSETRESETGFRTTGAAVNAKAGLVAQIRGNLLFRADVLSAWRYALPHVQVRAGIGYRF